MKTKNIQREYNTMNKVEIKRTMQKSKDVCDVNCFI